MSEYIIDILKEEYKDFPITLDGEVLLEKNKDGYNTTTVDQIKKIKSTFSDEEIKNSGWGKYKYILDTFNF